MSLSLGSQKPSFHPIPWNRPSYHLRRNKYTLDEQMDGKMNKQQAEGPGGATGEEEGPNQTFHLVQWLSTLTQNAGNTQVCPKRGRKEQREKHSLHLPGMADFQMFPDIKPCPAAYVQIKTSPFIISSALGPYDFSSKENPAVHLLD